MKAQHAARRVRWTRRRLVAVGAVVFSAVAAVAIALTLFRAPIVGSGQVLADPGIKFTSATATGGSASTCEATLNGGGVVTLNVTGRAGQFCNVAFGLQKTADGPTLKVQDFRYSGQTLEAFNASDCGAVVPLGPGDIVVNARVTIPVGQAAGAIVVQADAGVLASDEFDAGTCPTI